MLVPVVVPTSCGSTGTELTVPDSMARFREQATPFAYPAPLILTSIYRVLPNAHNWLHCS